jgi:hypothetical protein
LSSSNRAGDRGGTVAKAEADGSKKDLLGPSEATQLAEAPGFLLEHVGQNELKRCSGDGSVRKTVPNAERDATYLIRSDCLFEDCANRLRVPAFSQTVEQLDEKTRVVYQLRDRGATDREALSGQDRQERLLLIELQIGVVDPDTARYIGRNPARTPGFS